MEMVEDEDLDKAWLVGRVVGEGKHPILALSYMETRTTLNCIPCRPTRTVKMPP